MSTNKEKWFAKEVFLWVLGFLLLLGLSLHAKTVVLNEGTEKDVKDITNCSGYTGSIIVRTGVVFEENEVQLCSNGVVIDVIEMNPVRFSNGISLGFYANKADKCDWVQFFLDEINIIVKDTTLIGPPNSKDKKVPVKGMFMFTAGKVNLTTDTKKPNWVVDAGSSSSPSYGKGGCNIKTYKSNTIYDRPSDVTDGPIYEKYPELISDRIKKAKKDSNTIKIESVSHFESYLVCNKTICGKVSWTCTYTWEKSKSEGPVYDKITIENRRPIRLKPEQQTAIDKYENQNIFPSK